MDYSTKASIGLVKRIPSGVFQMGSRFHLRESSVCDLCGDEHQTVRHLVFDCPHPGIVAARGAPVLVVGATPRSKILSTLEVALGLAKESRTDEHL